MIIASDVDEVTAFLMPVWLNWYNKDYDDFLKVSDIYDWNLEKFVKPECGKQIYKYLNEPSLYDNVKPIEGSLESVEWLRDRGHRVVFVTSCGINRASGRKFEWLNDNGYKVLPEDYYEMRDKSLLRADVLFDDGYHNVKNFIGAGVLYNYNWNIDFDWHNRVSNWQKFLKFIEYYERVVEIPF